VHRTREGLVVRTDVMPQVGRGWYADPDADPGTDADAPGGARPLRYWDGSRWAPPAGPADRTLVWAWYVVTCVLPAVVLLLVPVLAVVAGHHDVVDRFLPAHVDGTAQAARLVQDVVHAAAWTAVIAACWGAVLGGVLFAETRRRCRTAVRWYAAAWWISAGLILVALVITVAAPALVPTH